MTSKPTFAYLPIRGLAQPIRYLLVIAGVDFIDKRYPFGENNSIPEFAGVSNSKGVLPVLLFGRVVSRWPGKLVP